MKFEVNCSILFTELPLLERPLAAKNAGFDAVEFWWPFAAAVPSDAEVDAFCRAIEDADVKLVGLNFFAGDMPAGERGVLSDPARVTEFQDSVAVLVRIAERTGVRNFNALYGQRLDGVVDAEQDRVAVMNLRFAADAVAGFGGTVLIEPLARGLNGAYPLETAADCAAVIDAVGEGFPLKFLFDSFHLGSNGEDLAKVIEVHAGRIGHVQIADVPGRGRPGTGELDFEALFSSLESSGYDGYVALEYKAQGPDSSEEFTWMGNNS